jgi:hypothetical protein
MTGLCFGGAYYGEAKKSVATELPKEVIQKEQGEWKFSFMSSKWFVLLVLLLAGIIWYGFYSTHTKVIAG